MTIKWEKRQKVATPIESVHQSILGNADEEISVLALHQLGKINIKVRGITARAKFISPTVLFLNGLSDMD